MKTEDTIRVNALPVKTYRFLKVNDSALAVPESLVQYRDDWSALQIVKPPLKRHPDQRGGGASPDQNPADDPGVSLTRSPFSALPQEIREIRTGMGEAADALFEEAGIESVLLTVSSFGATMMLPAEITCGSFALSSLVIRMEAHSEVAVILDIRGGETGCAAAKTFFGLSVRVIAEQGATLHLILVQRLDGRVAHFEDIGAVCAEGAGVDMTTLTLGGGQNYLGARATLMGDNSFFYNLSGYYCGGSASLDLNFIADQQGRDTTSRMIFRGVLTDRASKLFRGTIDFKRGATGSVGDEQEDTLLLSPDVVNKAVPLILCGEEDVEGRHGATIGRLSEEMLFYMCARGYSEDDARRLIVQARLKSVAAEIPDDRLRWEVEQWIEKEII